MISDEQINELYKHHIGVPLHGVINFSRELIALAQEVKPLDFIPLDHTNIIKQADTVCGEYFIRNYFDESCLALPGDSYYKRTYNTEAEAIEAANVDYRKRVLSYLVNGGV
jgi:hypothetical protein